MAKKKLKNDIELAMLGEKEVAERLTDKGILLPCPICGKVATVQKEERLFRMIKLKEGSWVYSHHCRDDEKDFSGEMAGCVAVYGRSKAEAIRRWNTRTPFLSKEILEELEGENEHDEGRSD